MWWINLFYNKGPRLSYNTELSKEKGWYSSNILILNVIELFPIAFILTACIESQIYSFLFYSIIISWILSLLIYIFSIIWEVNDAKGNGYDFPFKRVISSILAIYAYNYSDFNDIIYLNNHINEFDKSFVDICLSIGIDLNDINFFEKLFNVLDNYICDKQSNHIKLIYN